MNFSDKKQQLLQRRLATAGLLDAKQSLAGDRPQREQSDGYTVLSSAQRRMWYHAQFAEGSAAYNFCLVLRPEINANTPPLSADALTAALKLVVEKHEILRTRYRASGDGTPRQLVEPFLDPRITQIDLPTNKDSNRKSFDEQLDALACQARDEPFDLESDAPLRAVIVRQVGIIVAVILVLPHIAGDGGSFGIVLTDLEKAYDAQDASVASFSPGEIRYRDYAIWEQRRLGNSGNSGSLYEKQLQFWAEKLHGLPVELALPFDRPRPQVPSYRGTQFRRWLGTGLSNALRRTAKERGVTPLVALQTSVAIALKRIGAGVDIPLGTPVDLRQDSTLDKLVGFFSNTVVVRLDLENDPAFSDLLLQTHDKGLSAFDNRDVPFENIVEHINPPRAAARHPLFGVMVTATRPWPSLKFGTTPIALEEPQQQQAKFDLTFVIHDEGGKGRIGISLLYAQDLFNEATAQHLFEMVIGIIGQGAHHPKLQISQFAEFGYNALKPAAASLAAIIAEQQHSQPVTKRTIRLARNVTETEVVAALSWMLARHDALRLMRDEKTGQWILADATLLWETPILVQSSQEPQQEERFSARFTPEDDASGTQAPLLEISASGTFIDPESWIVLLAELGPIREGGRATPSYASGSYTDWLNRTAALAMQPGIIDFAEEWLDLFELASERTPLVASTSDALQYKVEIPDLDLWPDPVAIRKASLAFLLSTHQQTSALIEIEEPDRDRIRHSNRVVGHCRREFPLFIPAQHNGQTDEESRNKTIDTLLKSAANSLAFLGQEANSAAERAASYLLARDVNPQVAGAFDQASLPGLRLTIIVTDLGDDQRTLPVDILSRPEQNHWIICIDPKGQKASLLINGILKDTDINSLKSAWHELFPKLLMAACRRSSSQPSSGTGLISLSQWDQQRLEESFGPIKEVLPLSPLQEGLRFHTVGASSSSNEVYISQTTLELRGKIDPQRMHSAICKAVELTPNVAAGFAELAEKMLQIVPAEVYVPWRYEEASDEEHACRIADEEYRAPFDAAHPPMIRFALIHCNDFYRLVLTVHHILLDGWSIRLLFRQILRFYQDPASVNALPPFSRYLRWLASQDMEAARNVWRDTLAGTEPTILYPAGRGLEASTQHCQEQTKVIDRATTTALINLARSASTTLSTVLELAWGALLMRLTGSTNVVFGNVVSGRPAEIEGVDEIIGLLFNTVPFRVQIRAHDTVKTALHSIHAHKAGALQHAHVPLSELQQLAGHSPLFDTLFSIQNLPQPHVSSEQELQIGQAHVRDATHYPLSMAVTPTMENITLRLMFRRDLLTPQYAQTLIMAYGRLLEAFALDANQPLLTVDALPQPNPILPSSIAGKVMEIGSKSVADLLNEQAETTPDTTALVAGTSKFTFREIACEANRLAHFLQSFNVGAEHRIALLLPRSEWMIIAMFGVFAAHAAYVPIDPETPSERIRSMLEQSQPTVILTVNELSNRLPAEYKLSPKTVILDGADTRANLQQQAQTPPHTERPAGLNHLAYIIFTSGSTGQPKGVAVPYLGLTNMFINHRQEIFAPVLAAQNGRRLKIAHTTSFAFDASWEQLLWLLAGHEVHVIDDDMRRDPDRLLAYFDAEQIDAFDVTPTYGEYLVDHGLIDRDRPQGRSGTGIVFISLGGEAVGDALWTRLRETTGLGAYNLYGPTEYTINALGADLADSAEPSVGRPISNTRAYILGPDLLPAPIGVIGELYLGGVGLARGYVGRPANTAERFIANPFETAGARLYRTGDLARWRPDGSIDFLGRADSQLKIRGYRIEPAEIENILVSFDGVKRAAVIGKAGQGGVLQLVAYVICDPESADAEHLRDLLRSHLPSYMIPAAIVFVDDLPMTINGKLNAAALPAPSFSERTVAPPATPEERIICDAFAAVLERKSIGRFDDFFENGGHSLLTVRLVGLLRETFGPNISVRKIYNHPTPATLAASLVSRHSPADERPANSAERMAKDAILPSDIMISSQNRSRLKLSELKNILLTGAAGFVGSFVLAELLNKTPAKIHCLVRATDGAEANERVHNALLSYGLWNPNFADRIVGIPGDLRYQRFGLSPEQFETLAQQTDVILHNGGATNEFEHYDKLVSTNVEGTREILRLATHANSTQNTAVHFVSTASVVARQGKNPAIISETTRLSAHEVEPVGYVQSKWVAEELMHAAAAKGLPVTIHRLGRVSGHSVKGTCSTSVGFWHFIRSMLILGSAPILHSDKLTLAPVDYVVEALSALIEHGEASATYHISNRSSTNIRAIVAALERAGYKLDSLPFAAWKERLASQSEMNARHGDGTLSSVILLAQHLEKYDGDEMESQLGQEGVMAALASTPITPPPVTDDILDRYVAYFMEAGFFPPPQAEHL